VYKTAVPYVQHEFPEQSIDTSSDRFKTDQYSYIITSEKNPQVLVLGIRYLFLESGSSYLMT